jgi:hypothetical protein
MNSSLYLEKNSVKLKKDLEKDLEKKLEKIGLEDHNKINYYI